MKKGNGKFEIRNCSPAVQRLNPHLFGGAVDSRTASGAKPKRRRESENRGVETAAPSPRLCITLVQYRRKLLDGHDSLAFAVKPTVDLITEHLGFTSDSDPRLRWQYGQVETKGKEGIMVKFELL